MELWVRSQNKKKLTKTTNITLDNDETGILQNDECVFELLGKYKTKERALEVLDEIQNLIDDISDGKCVGCVYIMPEE